jgi:hypothetical protein
MHNVRDPLNFSRFVGNAEAEAAQVLGVQHQGTGVHHKLCRHLYVDVTFKEIYFFPTQIF